MFDDPGDTLHEVRQGKSDHDSRQDNHIFEHAHDDPPPDRP